MNWLSFKVVDDVSTPVEMVATTVVVALISFWAISRVHVGLLFPAAAFCTVVDTTDLVLGTAEGFSQNAMLRNDVIVKFTNGTFDFE